MNLRVVPFLSLVLAAMTSAAPSVSAFAQDPAANRPVSAYHVSSLCYQCHNNLKSSKGEDVSIGPDWRASMMANASRDPYWLASVRRETLDHPETSTTIQNDCGSCHMPLQRLRDKSQGLDTELFSKLPFHAAYGESSAAMDGVACAVCHQIQPAGLGTPATFNGNFKVAPLDENPRPVFGPFASSSDNASQTHIVTTGYAIQQSKHMEEAGLCASCHNLTTVARGPGGKEIGKLPEQMVYTEWLNSEYRDKQTCQQCHMPAVQGSVALASLMSSPRNDVHRHTFTGANFLMQSMLEVHRDELGVIAEPKDLSDAVERTRAFLQSQTARISLGPVSRVGGQLKFTVRVDNLTGHKFPTSFPSRRAWLHVTLTTSNGNVVFESGKLNPDGSIVGNANDIDPKQYSPHYTRITRPDQVEIFEPILGDVDGHVTTGLLRAVQYLKDNRILPKGFNKKSAPADVAVHGEASADANFLGGSSTTTYAIGIGAANGPLHLEAELVYQPIGFRWAHNLEPYKETEPVQFVNYYRQAAAQSALVLAHVDSQVSR